MSASDPTISELLLQTNVAIYNLLQKGYSSQTVGDRSYTIHNVGELQNLRAALRQEVRQSEDGSQSMRLTDIS